MASKPPSPALSHLFTRDRIRAVKSGTLRDIMLSRSVSAANRDSVVAPLLEELRRAEAEIQAKRDQFPHFGRAFSTVTPGVGDGFFRHFQGGSVFWYPGLGASEVHGAIRDEYARLGWESSFLGYPRTDELGEIGVKRWTLFQKGIITWMLETGAVAAGCVN